jgi:hypothetical protein
MGEEAIFEKTVSMNVLIDAAETRDRACRLRALSPLLSQPRKLQTRKKERNSHLGTLMLYTCQDKEKTLKSIYRKRTVYLQRNGYQNNNRFPIQTGSLQMEE